MQPHSHRCTPRELRPAFTILKLRPAFIILNASSQNPAIEDSGGPKAGGITI
jgi:hypothetical protein